MKPPNANIYIENNILKSDRCIWCGSRNNLTKSHIIPESLGGWYKPYLSCELCNNFLGRRYESEVSNNLYLAAAVSKLGLKKPHEAYKRGKKTDPETGAKMWILPDGKAKPIPFKKDDNSFLSTTDHAADYWIERLNKERPNWPIEPLKEFFNDPKKRVFDYGGERYSKDFNKGGKGLIIIEMPHLLDPFFVFKILYEFAAAQNFYSHELIRSYFQNMVEVNTEDKDNRIVFNDRIKSLSISDDVIFRSYKNLEEAPYKDFHAIILRISLNLNIYFELKFFGIYNNYLILNRFDQNDDLLNPFFDVACVFGFNPQNSGLEQYPNLACKDHILRSDVMVDLMMKRLQ